MSKPRHVIMQVVKRSSGSATHHVEFLMDDNFAERLRQLRSLVPPLGSLNKQRDLVIDKVRVRLPNAIWRSGNEIDMPTGAWTAPASSSPPKARSIAVARTARRAKSS
jgi:hypothetical protein